MINQRAGAIRSFLKGKKFRPDHDEMIDYEIPRCALFSKIIGVL